jgi:hypothetical protein
MATVETSVQLTIPEGCSLADLELLIATRLQEAGREMLTAACGAMEEEVLQEQAHQLKPNKRRARDLLTRFGWVRLERWSAKERNSGQYRYPLDEALSMEPNQHASPWVTSEAVALSERMSYREATSVLTRLLGVQVDYRTVWGWVQDALRASTAPKTSSKPRAVPMRAALPAAAPLAAPIVDTPEDRKILKPDFPRIMRERV